MPDDHCPKCGGKMFYDNYEDEYYCANCGYRIEAKKWLKLQTAVAEEDIGPKPVCLYCKYYAPDTRTCKRKVKHISNSLRETCKEWRYCA